MAAPTEAVIPLYLFSKSLIDRPAATNSVVAGPARLGAACDHRWHRVLLLGSVLLVVRGKHRREPFFKHRYRVSDQATPR